MDYILLHGVSGESEKYDAEAFQPDRMIRCTSRATSGDYYGRVTGWLREHPVDARRLCMLCGNGAMIADASAILRSQGVPRSQLSAETYF